jgi:pimeloyl-ACP methyl ester carboxylesterase
MADASGAAEPLRVASGGTGGPALLMLHGLGASAEVWNGLIPLVSERWRGQWLAPDLPGHGRSAVLRSYSYGSAAAAVSACLPPDEEVVVLGHSFGGVIGLVLASGWYGVRIRMVVALGVKVRWSKEDVARGRAAAARPVTWFDTRDEAVARYLRIAGLEGLVDPADPAALGGVAAEDGRWRVAVDPAAFGVGRPDIRGMLAACRAEVL